MIKICFSENKNMYLNEGFVFTDVANVSSFKKKYNANAMKIKTEKIFNKENKEK